MLSAQLHPLGLCCGLFLLSCCLLQALLFVGLLLLASFSISCGLGFSENCLSGICLANSLLGFLVSAQPSAVFWMFVCAPGSRWYPIYLVIAVRLDRVVYLRRLCSFWMVFSFIFSKLYAVILYYGHSGCLPECLTKDLAQISVF